MSQVLSTRRNPFLELYATVVCSLEDDDVVFGWITSTSYVDVFSIRTGKKRERERREFSLSEEEKSNEPFAFNPRLLSRLT